MPPSTSVTQQAEMSRLAAFHAIHFPGQPIPGSMVALQSDTRTSKVCSAGNDTSNPLGFYGDGVKRTLTKEQVMMFRHSEIQRLLNERKVTREREGAREEEHNISAPVTRESKKRRFYDEPSSDIPNVDTLMYDDQPETLTKSGPGEKKFLWPLLGQEK